MKTPLAASFTITGIARANGACLVGAEVARLVAERREDAAVDHLLGDREGTHDAEDGDDGVPGPSEHCLAPCLLLTICSGSPTWAETIGQF